jgi:hypothetical protein
MGVKRGGGRNERKSGKNGGWVAGGERGEEKEGEGMVWVGERSAI